jgi:uncharacterized RDD family membrane protein YckC
VEPLDRFCRDCGVAQGAESRYRGFWMRVLASILDWAIVFLPLGIIYSVLGLRHGTGIFTTTTHVYGSNGFSATDHNVHAGFYLRGPADVFTLFVFWIYCAWFESCARQATLGKQLCGCRVTDEDGRPISFDRATGRHFAKYLSALILFIGFMMAGWTRRKQGLHDKLAHTTVRRAS